MVEKNSGAPSSSEVVAPVHQSEQTDSVPDVGTTTSHTKQTRKSKIKPDTENDTVACKDPVNAEQSNIPTVAAGSDNPTQQPATGENKDPVVAEAIENKVVIADQKCKHKRPRPPPRSNTSALSITIDMLDQLKGRIAEVATRIAAMVVGLEIEMMGM